MLYSETNYNKAVAFNYRFGNTEIDKEKARHAKTCYAKPPV